MRVEDNFALVNLVLRRHGNGVLEYEDAFQEGCIGLIKAMRLYNPERGKWTNFAAAYIWHAIQDAQRKASHSRTLRTDYTTISLDEWRDANPKHDIVSPIEIAVTIYPVKQALEALAEQDRYVLRALYEDGMYGSQVAETLRISASRVSQIRKRAIRRLAKELRRLSTE